MSRRSSCIRRSALVLLGCALAPSAAWPGPLPKPARGLRAYHYQSAEVVNGAQQSGYSVDFDLLTARDGSIKARVLSARMFHPGSGWESAIVPADCRAAMRAPAGGLAEATLWPISESAAKLGGAFLDECAPASVFFPLTDILNITLIAVSPKFRVRDLHGTGDTVRYGAFNTAFERLDRSFKEVVPGGDVRLVTSDGRRIVIDWAPDPADLEIEQPGPQGRRLRFRGSETWAFRLTFDSRAGILQHAEATRDDIDLEVGGLKADGPPPRVKITRTVIIELRDAGH